MCFQVGFRYYMVLPEKDYVVIDQCLDQPTRCFPYQTSVINSSPDILTLIILL